MDPILVKCEDGKLIITLDKARADTLEQEKAFLEKETRKLEQRHQKERKELRARCVAERKKQGLCDVFK